MPGIAVGIGVGIASSRRSSAASSLSGTWAANATIDTRSDFDSDTVLPEFGGAAAPEQSDAVATSLVLVESGGTVTGTYADETWITCALTGTYDSGTGAVALSGACDDFDVVFAGTLTTGTLAGTVTVERGSTGGASSSEDRTFSAMSGGSAVSLGSAYYVDSINGSSGNAGTSPDAPLDTIANAVTAGWGAEGTTLRLARGSRWREMPYSANDTVTVEAYGVGPRPIVDGSDVKTGWGLTAAQTYTYQVQHTPAYDNAGGGSTFVVLEDGIALQRVADVATCEATTGSCCVPESSGATTYTLYIHPSDDGNPASNGKVYEVPSRENGVWLAGDGCTIAGVMGRAPTGDNGCVRNGGSGSTTDDCVGVWGPLHHFYFSTDAHFTRNVALWSLDRWNGGSPYGGVMAVGYAPDGGGTATAVVTDCAAIEYDRADLRDHSDAFYGHVSPGNDPWASFTYDRIYTRGASSSVSGSNGIAAISIDRLLAEDPGSVAVDTDETALLSLTRSRLLGHVEPNDAGQPLIKITEGATVTLSESILTASDDLNPQDLVRFENGSLAATRCIFDGPTDPAYLTAIDDNSPNTVLLTAFTRNVVYRCSGSIKFGTVSDGIATGASDYNQIHPGTLAQTTIQRGSSSDNCVWLTAWQSEHADLDQNSVATEPTWAVEADANRPLYASKSDGFDAGPTHEFDFEADQPTGYAWATFVDAL